MDKSKSLALLGGDPVRVEPFPAYNVIGVEEKNAAQRVLDSGILSRFLGAWHEDFYGGPEVRAFEKEWADVVGVDYGISVNSCTSGLYAAIGAAGIGPGDEVIVSSYTMAASATAALIFNGVPVFADIDQDTYCISAKTIEAKITSRTKAIIVVHIFGQAADMDPIMVLARRHGLVVIEDCAQAPFATYKGRQVGGLGHMGVFSLNYHKHIHTGEGGMITTSDPNFAERLQLIRNHAEAVVERKGVTNLVNMIGFNFRLGEIEAAIGREQLKKAPALIAERLKNVKYIESKLSGFEGLKMPYLGLGSTHVYYAHALDYDSAKTGVSRKVLLEALRAELPITKLRETDGGPLIGGGYVKPLYMLPIFQKRIGYGGKGCPFSCPHYEGVLDYHQGLCPNAEDAHFNRLISHELIRPGMSTNDIDDVVAAFAKVWSNLEPLKLYEKGQV